jgi:UDP-N-acetylmuramoylalanine-D-glutamate ligase
VVFSLARTTLRGPAQRENVMAACRGARAGGAGRRAAGGARRSRLRHRLETARGRGRRLRRRFQGTNVGALLKSLEGYRDGSVVLIAGGLAKGGDHTVARDLLARVRHSSSAGGTGIPRGQLARRDRPPCASASPTRCPPRSRAHAAATWCCCRGVRQHGSIQDYAARGDAFAEMVEAIEHDAVARC